MPEFILTVCVIGVGLYFWLPYKIKKVIREYETERLIEELTEENIALQMRLEDLEDTRNPNEIYIHQYMN